jgi:small subunit ribosomal protein S16
MLRIRLQRRGKNNYATFRVVVAEQTAPIKGRFIADVGSYNPHTNEFVVEKEAVQNWLAKGVQPSSTVHNLLVTHGFLQAPKKTIWRPPADAAPKSTEEATSEATPKETPR